MHTTPINYTIHSIIAQVSLKPYSDHEGDTDHTVANSTAAGFWHVHHILFEYA